MENKIAKKQQDLLAKDHIDEIEEYTRDNDMEEKTQYNDYASPGKATREARALVYPLDVNSSQSKNGEDRYSRNIEMENTIVNSTHDTVLKQKKEKPQTESKISNRRRGGPKR